MKIVFTDSATVTSGEISLDILNQFGDVEIYDLTKTEQVADRIKNADIVLCNKTPMTAENMSNAKNLKYIGIFATGYNNIDLNYTNSHNITVCNAGEYSTKAVAQLVFSYMLDNYNKISQYRDFVNGGGWKNAKVFSVFPIDTKELYNKTIGIVGFGSIGSEVAKIANAFGMKVLAYNRSNKSCLGVEFTSIEYLVANSDFITVHCPLNNQSYKMFNSNLFSKFKKGAFFINTSRGGVVDEYALLEALQNGTLSGAAIDVLDKEPMEKDCILYNVPNLTITSHIGWASLETRQRLLDIVVDNLRSFLEGRPKNIIK